MRFSSACSGCFAGLSCAVRIDIINLLRKKKKLSVLEIAGHFKVTQPTISHHLIYLREMGILKSKKEGRKIYYFIDPKCGSEECGVFA